MPLVYVRGERPRHRYTFVSFVGDTVMTIITFGIWLIWIVVRELRA